MDCADLGSGLGPVTGATAEVTQPHIAFSVFFSSHGLS